MNKMAWKTESLPRTQPWGSEVCWTALNFLHGKLLNIKKGLKTSLKYHQLKDEVLFLLEGKVEIVHGCSKTLGDPVKFALEKTILIPGQAMVIQAGSPYRVEALVESQIIEIGNRMADVPIRLLDDYERKLDDRAHNWEKHIREIE